MYYVKIGLVILSFAFVLSIFGSVCVPQPWRLVAILQANPHLYLSFIRDVLLYLILCPAVGIVFSIIGYAKERKFSTGVLSGWPLLVISGIFAFWGALGLRYSYTSYYDAMHLVQYDKVVGIDDFILSIYVTLSVAYVLWIFAGILFIYSLMFRIARPNNAKT